MLITADQLVPLQNKLEAYVKAVEAVQRGFALTVQAVGLIPS